MTTMKIWKIVFVLLTAFSLASCDKEDENNMMLTAIESIASTQWSLNRQATHREGKTVIEKFDTESAYRYVYDFRETDYQIICYHTDGTMTSVVERGTYTYDAMRRVLTLVDADGFAKYYSISSNKANQMSLRQTLGGTQTILELTKIITIR
jgi:hypothetical protein